VITLDLSAAARSKEEDLLLYRPVDEVRLQVTEYATGQAVAWPRRGGLYQTLEKATKRTTRRAVIWLHC